MFFFHIRLDKKEQNKNTIDGNKNHAEEDLNLESIKKIEKKKMESHHNIEEKVQSGKVIENEDDDFYEKEREAYEKEEEEIFDEVMCSSC